MNKMGRLIDADKFKVYLQEYLYYGHAIPWVDAQPTAYDVEKVLVYWLVVLLWALHPAIATRREKRTNTIGS